MFHLSLDQINVFVVAKENIINWTQAQWHNPLSETWNEGSVGKILFVDVWNSFSISSRSPPSTFDRYLSLSDLLGLRDETKTEIHKSSSKVTADITSRHSWDIYCLWKKAVIKKLRSHENILFQQYSRCCLLDLLDWSKFSHVPASFYQAYT